MVVSYQLGYAVQDEVGVYTIVMNFNTAMVNNENKYFGCIC